MMQNLRTIWRFRQEHMRDLRKPHINHVNHAENPFLIRDSSRSCLSVKNDETRTIGVNDGYVYMN